MASMDSVAAAYLGKQVHVIWENLNTYRTQAVWQAVNARHVRRFHFHFTPLHATGVNQIELWFHIEAPEVFRDVVYNSRRTGHNVGRQTSWNNAQRGQRNNLTQALPLKWTSLWQ